MKVISKATSLALCVSCLVLVSFAAALDADSNPAMDKFKTDMKSAVMNGSITIPQVKELQTNAETLKSMKTRTPGSSVDLLSPYHAVANMKAIMAQVKPQDRQLLEEDLQAVLANQHTETPTGDASPNAGKKLGKDIFMAVMHGKPTDDQVSKLQESLNALQEIKDKQERPLQALMALKSSKSQITDVMNAGQFRPQDRDAVLADLNNLGPQGGSGGRGRLRGRG